MGTFPSSSLCQWRFDASRHFAPGAWPPASPSTGAPHARATGLERQTERVTKPVGNRLGAEGFPCSIPVDRDICHAASQWQSLSARRGLPWLLPASYEATVSAPMGAGHAWPAPRLRKRQASRVQHNHYPSIFRGPALGFMCRAAFFLGPATTCFFFASICLLLFFPCLLRDSRDRKLSGFSP